MFSLPSLLSEEHLHRPSLGIIAPTGLAGDDPYGVIHVLELRVIRTAFVSRCSALACCGRRRSGGPSFRLIVPIVQYVQYRLNVAFCGRSFLGIFDDQCFVYVAETVTVT